jgi:hypothetical protein
MSLVLQQTEEEWPREDYHVRHGDLRVGRIWNNPSARPGTQWLWSMNGVVSEADAKLRYAGSAATLAAAKAELATEWAKWLAWADLCEEAQPGGRGVAPDGRQEGETAGLGPPAS